MPGKVALWLEDESKGKDFGSVDEDTIALYVKDTGSGKSFYYMPACARVTPELADRISGADLIFFDGTLWVDDEMIRDGVGIKTGQRMGHISVSGEDGTVARPGGPGDKAENLYPHQYHQPDPVFVPTARNAGRWKPPAGKCPMTGWISSCRFVNIP